MYFDENTLKNIINDIDGVRSTDIKIDYIKSTMDIIITPKTFLDVDSLLDTIRQELKPYEKAISIHTRLVSTK
jgi:hypothetical protein